MNEEFYFVVVKLTILEFIFQVVLKMLQFN